MKMSVQFRFLVASLLYLYVTLSCYGDTKIPSGSRAPAETTCYDCFCQCSSLSFKSHHGKIEGNCKRYDGLFG